MHQAYGAVVRPDVVMGAFCAQFVSKVRADNLSMGRFATLQPI